MATRRRPLFVIPSGYEVSDDTTLTELSSRKYPLEIQNLPDLKKQVARRALAAIGRVDVDDSWFDDNGELLPAKLAQITLLPTLGQVGLVKRVSESFFLFPGQNTSFGPDAPLSVSTFLTTLNNRYVHSTGPQSSGVVLVALAGATALLAAASAFSGFLAILTPPARLNSGSGFFNIPQYLGFPDTEFPLFQCILRGIGISLGLGRPIRTISDATGIVVDLALSILPTSERSVPLVDSPSYYAGFFRVAVEGVEELRQSARNLSPTNFNSFRDFVERIRNLGIVRFLSVAANIGNLILRQEKNLTFPADFNARTMPPAFNNPYGFRGLPGLERTNRSRLNDGVDGNQQPFSMRDLPSAFLPPTSAKKVRSHIGVADKYIPQLARTGQNQRVLAALQKELEKEHVPFWIQDMRTGEVAAFHAFLDGIENSFSPQLSTTATMGMMDDVQTLSKTTRSIRVSFTLVATSKPEHDYLWWVVNWLTMLIYPQWSEGIVVDSESQRTSPFGRVPTSSPLIRLRLADIFRSNAGDESIRRLLTSETVLASERNQLFEPGGVLDEARNVALQDRNNTWEFEAGKEYRLFANPQGYEYRVRSTLEGGGFGLSQQARLERDKSNRTLKTYEDTIFVFGGTTQRGKFARLVGATEDDPRRRYYGTVYQMLQDGSRGDLIADGTEVWVSRKDVQPLQITGSKVRLPDRAGALRRATAPRSEIKSADELAFVQAIRRGSLDGLAGMVSNLEVDLNWTSRENFALEMEPGSMAPIGVRVSLTMNVIHDIQPGKDSFGSNRAPIFPVGKSSNDSIGSFYSEEHNARLGEPYQNTPFAYRREEREGGDE